MRRTRDRIRRCGLMAIGCALLTGCATTSRSPWVQNGTRIGTICRNKTAYGAECRYVDTAGQLHRIERRNHDDNLLSGAAVRKFAYSPTGELAEETNCDASDAPAACEEGYVFRKYSYSLSDVGDRVVAQSFLDGERKPICTVNGYAYARMVHEGTTPRLKEVFLEDHQNRPASATWDGVTGVAHAKYAVLDGIGEVRCGVYFAPSGEVVGRKAVEGSCSYYSEQTTTTTHYHGGRSSKVMTRR